MQLHKYHALGNDYLVLDPAGSEVNLSGAQIQRICDRHYGLGSDGMLVGPLPCNVCDFGLRLYNPDGNEFEKSGNGLRIFARYLWDTGRVGTEPFSISTLGGPVRARVHEGGRRVTIEMGQVSFESERIPVAGRPREVLDEVLTLGGWSLRVSCATVGNPHCVVLRNEVSAAEAQTLGPLIENASRFPRRTNVQFMQVLDRANVRIEIWERGAGYTLASGSSSSAAAAVAHRLGLVDSQVAVHMPGGSIDVTIGPDWSITLAGGVTRVCQATLWDEMFDVS
jgi:diaminopimelate epimerase